MVLAVSFGEEAVTVQKFVQARGYQGFVVALDKEGRSLGQFQVLLRPTLFLVDRAGVVRQVLAGPVAPPEMDRELAPLLND